MRLEETLRQHLVANTSVPEAAFIYENEDYSFPDDLQYIVKEWRIDMVKGRFTDTGHNDTIMLEYDVTQRQDCQEDFITGPAEEIMNALFDYVDSNVWDVQVETGQAQHGIIAIIATIRLVK